MDATVQTESKWTEPSLVTTALFSWTYGLAELQANSKGPPSSFENHSEQVFLVSVSFRVCRN